MMNTTKNTPLVSVVITGKNEEQIISQCILSILKQNYANFELIFVDAKSTDNTLKIVENLKKTLSSYPNCKDFQIISIDANSPAKGRNIGVKFSKGDVISFTDADCFAHTNWITNMVSIMNQYSKVIVGGPNILCHKNSSNFLSSIDSVLSTYLGSGGSAQFLKISKIKEVSAIPACNMGISKKLFNEIHGFDESMKFNEDSDLCLRIKDKGYKIIFSPDVKVDHFMGIESLKDFHNFIYTYGLERGKNLNKNHSLFTKFNFLSIASILSFFSLAVFSFFNDFFSLVLIFLITLIPVIFLSQSIKISFEQKSFNLLLLSFFILILIHSVYNLGLVKGFLSK